MEVNRINEVLFIAESSRRVFYPLDFGILNVAGYYDPMLALTAHAVSEGFVRPGHSEMVIVEDNSERLLWCLATASVPSEAKWVGDKER